MNIKSIFYFICSLFLIVGCSDTTGSPDFIDGQLLHPIQCKAINLDCEERLEQGKSIQCKGTTDKGERCKNNTLRVCGYCHLHITQAPPAGRCLIQTKNVSGICDYHKEFAK